MRRFLFYVLCTFFLLAGCAPAQVEAPVGGYTFTDDLGRTVSLDKPERVAVLTGSFTDLWVLAGGEDSLVATAGDAWTSFGLELGEDVANLGAIKSPDVERLFASAPDLVIASSNTAAQVALLDVLEQAGLRVAYFNVTNFDEYLRMLKICTDLTGDSDAFETYGTALAEQIEQAKARADGSAPSVLYVRCAASGCRVKNSRDTVLGEMLSDLGCINVADREGALLEQLSMEAILRADPDFIFAVLQGADPEPARLSLEQSLLSDPAWQSLTAVNQGRFHVLEHRLYNLKPNAKWGEAYENLANILYPGP